MYLVWLVRWVGHADDRIDGTARYREPAGWYAKPAELPLPPSVGIHLMIRQGGADGGRLPQRRCGRQADGQVQAVNDGGGPADR